MYLVAKVAEVVGNFYKHAVSTAQDDETGDTGRFEATVLPGCVDFDGLVLGLTGGHKALLLWGESIKVNPIRSWGLGTPIPWGKDESEVGWAL